MFQSISRTAHNYLLFYQRSLLREWHDMTPIKYACLLIGISVVGFLLMKSSQTK